ncbi:MAG: rod shape-determining protein MreC [Pseudomonadota bacterium]
MGVDTMQDLTPKRRKSPKRERQVQALVRRSGLGVALLVLALFAIIAQQLRYQPLMDLRETIMDISRPVLQATSYPIVPLEELYQNIRYLILGLDENERLRQNEKRLLAWQARAKLLALENQQLRALLNANAFEVPSYVSARIIGGNNANYSRSLLIDVGKEHSLQISDPVINSHGLIGQVVHVAEKTARVLLLDDLNSFVPVVVQPGGHRALVAGTQSPSLALQYIDAKSPIIDGAHVLTSGLGGVFPSGLPVGVVQLVEEGTHHVRPFARDGEMGFLQVVVKKGEGVSW